MKKLFNKENIILFILILYIFSYSFFVKLDINRNFYNIFSWFLITIFTYFMVGYVKNRSINKKITMQYIFIYIIIYLILIYLLGLITGFSRVPLSFKFVDIFKNIINVILVIFLKEFTRYMLVFKRRYNKNYLILLIIVFILIDIIMVMDMYELNSLFLILTFIGEVVLSSIYNNLLQTFLVYNTGFLPSFLYSSILKGYIYFVPIIPNVGMYLNMVLSIILVISLILKLNFENYRYQNKSRRKVKISKKYLNIPIGFVLLMMIILTSGVFKYKIMAIVSNSMSPYIQVGDTVIYEKLNSYEDLVVGDILVFTNNDTVLVHRIVEISKKDKEIFVYTKGDNNQCNDDFITTEENIIGIVKTKIKYIGYPAYWINNVFR